MDSGKVFELTELCSRFHLLSDLYDLLALYTIWFLVYDFVFFLSHSAMSNSLRPHGL